MSGWLAGSAISTFPVPPGTPLGGYADRTGPSTGTLDQLEIGALSLQSGTRELHLVSADVLGVDADLVTEVASATGIRERDLLICASHTHSGPGGLIQRVFPVSADTVDPVLRGRLVDVIAETVRRARDTREPVVLSHSRAVVDRAWTNRNDPTALADDRVRSLQVRRLNGSLHAMLMLIPCHPTVLSALNLEASADLLGDVRRAVRAVLPSKDSEAALLTITGAAGDISARFTRQGSSVAEVNRLGMIVAGQVIASLPQTTGISAGTVSGIGSQALPMRSLDAEGTQLRHRRARAELERLQANPTAREAEIRRAYTRVQGAEILRGMGETPPVTLHVSDWRLGTQFGIVSIPGEPFSSIGVGIESGSPTGETWVVGLANGFLGYFPDTAAYDRETYEALASPFARNVGNAVLELAHSLFARYDNHS